MSPLASDATTGQVGESPLATRWGMTRAGILLAVLVSAPLVLSASWQVNILFFVALYAAMSVGWNLVGGFAGYPSLGHAAFFGFGAYAIATLFPSSHPLSNSALPFFALIPVGLAGALIAVPIGALAMRTRSDVFAIVTITLLFVGQTLAFNLKGISGGAQGKAVAGADFGVATYERPFYYVAAALFVVALLAAYFVIRSKLGLALTAIRSDEDKARGIGVRTNGLKVLTFAVSVGIVTAAGGLWAYYVSFIYPQFAFDPLVTIAIVLMTFLGGRGTLWGPVIGAVVLEYGQKELAYDLGGDRIYLIAYAAIFLAIILLLPRGILPTVQTKRRAARLTKARDAVPGQLPGSRPEGRTTEPPVNGSVNEVKA